MAWRRVLHFLRESAEGAAAVENLFTEMDGNGDRNLSVTELAQGLVRLGVRLHGDELLAFYADLDANKDGQVCHRRGTPSNLCF